MFLLRVIQIISMDPYWCWLDGHLSIPLLPISEFVLDEKLQRNASKFDIFYVYEKATLGFRIYKIWQILKHFAGTFHQAQTLKLGEVNCQVKKNKSRG